MGSMKLCSLKAAKIYGQPIRAAEEQVHPKGHKI